ncbi:glycosyltransferase family 4 protein [Formosa sp. L2A11]|uniref:glycosyltransferase family 4 protein n=1 Tax=Formosa sp. L2A11 TaxID=2686363 RepID=UPI00131E8B13|nr:glycosyltransferase family 4 protein [Formosa sp. L2A11]
MKRKIIFISFSIYESSVSDYFLSLSVKLAEKHRVIIITDRLERNDLPKNIEAIKWPGKRGTTLRDFLFLKSQVSKFKPDMMIANFGSVNMFLIVGYLLRIPHRIAWVHTISSQFKSNNFKQLRKQLIYKLGTKIYTNSNATKLDIISTFNVPEKKINVIFNSVKEYNVKSKQIDFDKITYVGRMHPSKGIDTLIKAFSIVNNKFPKVYLELIGGNLKDELLNDYITLAKTLKVKDNIKFLGSKPKHEVLEAFSSAYFSVVPSVVEAFGYVVIESFSVKTPVIGSRTSGISEIIRDKKDGLLFEPKNENDLAEKMIKLLNDRSLRNQFSANCYTRFITDFEVNGVTNKLAEDFCSLVEEIKK